MSLPLDCLPELSPNLQALPIVNKLIADSRRLRTAVMNIAGATVLDCGIAAEGGLEAGVLFSRVCLGGLADVRLGWQDFGGLRWPSVEVWTDHPVRACMASQYAGWLIKCAGRSYMGSGPACAVVCKGSLFRLLGYADDAEHVVLCLESARLPTEEAVAHITAKCRRRPEQLTILVAPTASLTGTVQVAARSLETGLFKLRRLGYDLGKIVSGAAVSPLSPVAASTTDALGRTNDAISYGATVTVLVRDEDDALSKLIDLVPSCAAPEYGLAYHEVASAHDNFFNLSPDRFNPAVMVMTNLSSGRSFSAGELRPDVLRRAFGLV